ncbi:MAG TPA: hypothetical protein VFZ25_00525 [Chloroflexota bacterium]|nr:hypothetical protein [Chloroflexota bacterium]
MPTGPGDSVGPAGGVPPGPGVALVPFGGVPEGLPGVPDTVAGGGAGVKVPGAGDPPVVVGVTPGG